MTNESTGMGPPMRDEHSPLPPEPSMADSPDNQGKPIGAHDPTTMHRREDDDQARAGSPDFHDRPGSGEDR
jgi:hypothetical protein